MALKRYKQFQGHYFMRIRLGILVELYDKLQNRTCLCSNSNAAHKLPRYFKF